MSKSTIRFAAAALFGLFFMVNDAKAQCGPALRADIPFDFVVNGREAKAGEYRIERSDCLTSTPVVILRDSGGRFLTVVNHSATEIRNRSTAPMIVFADYGGKRFLSEVRDVDGRYSFRARPTKAETRLAQSTAPTRKVIPVLAH